MDLIDSHCHLDDDRFNDDRDEVVARARTASIRRFVVPSTTAQRWTKVKQVCETNAGAHAAYGLHPMFSTEHQSAHLNQLDGWIDREKPVAVGECGLDFFNARDDEKWQLQVFNTQLQLARNHGLPVIVHVRKAMDEVISLLRSAKLSGGVIHSFSGSRQQAEQLIDLNFKLGIAATVSFERAKKLRQVVAAVADTALLIESDAPDQPGDGHRGERNEPGFIVEHLQTIAVLRDVSVSELAEQLKRNSEALFQFNDKC